MAKPFPLLTDECGLTQSHMTTYLIGTNRFN